MQRVFRFLPARTRTAFPDNARSLLCQCHESPVIYFFFSFSVRLYTGVIMINALFSPPRARISIDFRLCTAEAAISAIASRGLPWLDISGQV